jgi:hypothetical protein
MKPSEFGRSLFLIESRDPSETARDHFYAHTRKRAGRLLNVAMPDSQSMGASVKLHRLRSCRPVQLETRGGHMKMGYFYLSVILALIPRPVSAAVEIIAEADAWPSIAGRQAPTGSLEPIVAGSDVIPVEVIAEADGVREVGAEVCFSKGQRYGTVVEQMAPKPAVRCLPADRILDIPRGTWQLYVKKEDDVPLLSFHPLKIVFSHGSSDEFGVGRLIVELSRGAWVDLAELGETAAQRSRMIYVANTGGPPSMLPVGDAAETLVPAGIEVRVLELEGKKIVRVGQPMTLAAGERGVARWAEAASVVIPISVVASEVALDGRTMPFLEVVRRSGEVVHTFRLDKEWLGLLFVPAEALKPGTYDVISGDERWVAVGSSFRWAPVSQELLVASDVRLEPAAAFATIAWILDPDLIGARGACGDQEAMHRTAQLRTWSCPDQVELRGARGERECSLLKMAEIATAEGSLSWPLPATGRVWAELRFGRHSSVAPVVEGRGESRADLRLTPRTISGMVRIGSDPFHAAMLCGHAFTTTDSGTGRFRCWLPDAPRFPLTLEIRPCDGSQPYLHVVETSEEADRFLDIAIPDNEVTVRVTDGTGAPVSSARVWSYLGAEEGALGNPRVWGETTAEGMASSTRLSNDVGVTVCAGKSGFRSACHEVPPSPSSRKTVELTLLPASVGKGRVIAPARVESGSLYAVANGRVVRRARVSPDGSFELSDVDPRSVSFILSSITLPLTLLSPVDGESTLILAVPPYAENRDVRVTASGRGPLTLIMNGILVPLDVMLQHQSLFGEQYYLQPDTTTVLRRINTYGEVFVIFGREALPGEFENPDRVASMPRLGIGPQSSLTFH